MPMLIAPIVVIVLKKELYNLLMVFQEFKGKVSPPGIADFF
jgi:hypothetical protein